MPVELPNATAAIVPERKSSFGFVTLTTIQPRKAPTETNMTGKKSIGHTAWMRSMFTEGSTRTKSSAGIVTFIDIVLSSFAPALVIMPVLPRYSPAPASVAA